MLGALGLPTLALVLSQSVLSVRAASSFLRTRSPSVQTAFVKPTRRLRHTARMSSSGATQNPYNFSWQQTMIRIKDPEKSLPFYETVLGMRRLHEYHFDGFSLYFMYTPRPPEATDLPKSGTKASEKILWTMHGTTVELTWNHGTEKDPNFTYNNGNVEPHRGFGHLAIATNDVYDACKKFEEAGVAFQKKPDEGRMKGLAFIKDPDGYWIEVISRDKEHFPHDYPYNLAQTMLRVKDPEKSLRFYRDLLGMHLVAKKTFSDFSLYFLAQHIPLGGPLDPESPETYAAMKKCHDPVLELTHNHGTESDPDFSYHNGNTEPRGFGHTGFLVNDLESACNFLEENGVRFQKKPSEGSMRGLAFAIDPDGYWVEIIQRGLTI